MHNDLCKLCPPHTAAKRTHTSYMKCEHTVIRVSGCGCVCVSVCCRLSKEKLLMALHECTNEIVQARLTALPVNADDRPTTAPPSLSTVNWQLTGNFCKSRWCQTDFVQTNSSISVSLWILVGNYATIYGSLTFTRCRMQGYLIASVPGKAQNLHCNSADFLSIF